MRPRNGGTQPFTVKDYNFAGEADFGTTVRAGKVADNGRKKYTCYGVRELRRDTGVHYCVPCQARALAPVDLSAYKEQLPGTAQQMRHSAHLPKYDESLLPPALRKGNKRGRKPGTSKLGDWKTKLLQAFAARGPMTSEEMVRITGHSSKASLISVCNACFPLKSVGSAWPRQGRGNPAYLYMPKEQA